MTAQEEQRRLQYLLPAAIIVAAIISNAPDELKPEADLTSDPNKLMEYWGFRMLRELDGFLKALAGNPNFFQPLPTLDGATPPSPTPAPAAAATPRTMTSV